jgi:two-component system response regulator
MNPQTVKILLVEDNPNDVELTLHAFEKYKLANSMHVVRDGQEALDYLFGTGDEGYADRVQPQVILLDLKLPKVDGLEVLRRIRSDAALGTVPVVILTSSREERDVVESYQLGVNSFIVKPIEFDKFVETVQTLGLYWLLLNEPPVAPGRPGVGSQAS